MVILATVVDARDELALSSWEKSIVANMVFLGIGVLFSGCMCLSHIGYVCNNQTTLEVMKKVSPSTYDQGIIENLRSVLGDSAFCWFIPCVWGVTRYDGMSWDGPVEVANSSV
eukprot:jgi/Bigna1/125823/aug1.1_g531